MKISILVDTSQKDGRLLILDQNYKTLSFSEWTHPLRHTDELSLAFKSELKFLREHQIESIYFISGPGSFTGLRVGASFVKSLGLIFKNKPIYSISSFRLIASHIMNTQSVDVDFSVCIASIGNMVFQADYRFSNKVFQKETVHTNGAHEYRPSNNKVFSPNQELQNKFTEINYVRLDANDYAHAIKEHDLDKASIKACTHLDLYPLYLRKSEAEEKYRYDKAKL